MKHLLAIFLLLLPLFSWAQVPPPKQWPTLGVTVNHIEGHHGDQAAGHRWVAYRRLDDNGFRYVPVVLVKRGDFDLVLPPQVPGEAVSAYLNRAWEANSPLPCSDTAIKSLCETGASALTAVDSPEPPRFVVAKNGTGTTRPVYSFDTTTQTVGVLLAGVRAPVLTNGEPTQCACWAMGARKGKTAYCTWFRPAGDPQSDQVTMCAKN